MNEISTRPYKSANSPKLANATAPQSASTPVAKPSLKVVVEAALSYLTQSDCLHDRSSADDSTISGHTLVTMAIDALRAASVHSEAHRLLSPDRRRSVREPSLINGPS